MVVIRRRVPTYRLSAKWAYPNMTFAVWAHLLTYTIEAASSVALIVEPDLTVLSVEYA